MLFIYLMPTLTNDIFIKKSEAHWGIGVWGYEKVNYTDFDTKIVLICLKHNLDCLQTPHQHLRNRNGTKITACIECETEFIKQLHIEKTNIFVKKFKELKSEELLEKKFINIINKLLDEKLKRVPNTLWDNKEAVNCYIDWFKKKYNILKDEDWYNIQAETIVKNEGSGLLTRYNHSLIDFLKYYYSDKVFLPWKFYRVGNNYWKEKENRKYCLNWLIKKLDYNNYEDYYNLSLRMFCDNECARLVGCYQDSTYELLKDLCSDYKWKAYKFLQVPVKHWTNAINRREWCDDYYVEHNFTSIEDWYKINQDMIKEWYGNGLLQRYKSSPYQMLKDIYPDYNWDKSKFKICGYSKKSCEFTKKLSKAIQIPIRYALSTDGEYRIPSTRYSADNYIEKYEKFSKIIIEFHGCDVHGCVIEECNFRKKTKELNRFGCNYIDAYNKTLERSKLLKNLGYIVIELWECEYKNIIDYKKWFEEKLNNYCLA